MKFIRKLPIPQEIKNWYPISKEMAFKKKAFDKELEEILSGKSDRMVLVIGPCSADREDAVLEYVTRLAEVGEKVKDRLMLIPRVYTNKPRTTGKGYKGMMHQPDPSGKSDILNGLIAIRRLHTNVAKETGMFPADEMLYPENYRYLSDILSYVAVGARSVEDQQHRMTASGIEVPVGMKNPTSGDMTVLLNSILATREKYTFLYRGWEVETEGNPYSHAVLRGAVHEDGTTTPNYQYEYLEELAALEKEKNLSNPAAIIDTNHCNSGKHYEKQEGIALDVMHSRTRSSEVKKLVKGFMIESYLLDGAQKIGEGRYGCSITDPCLGFEKSEKLIYEIADRV